ncbi:salicylate hydroxylase [Fusarium globosum]|uniref:Salicylate hydroxylase n=1 Tax=Fusarium globosum TaxID=78864 RepID=A0A8H5XJV5_9HYPO|nr:salicylate hydroxylase [Fusarium globosum]
MKNLNVIVVGAGIGGLATALAFASDGHRVKVLDGVIEFAEVGAGIRVPPNSSRLCKSWGVDFDSVPKQIAKGIRFVDWKNNGLLDVPYDDMLSKHGAPYYFFHRADFVDIMLKAVKKNPNIKIITRSKVVEYDVQRPAVRTESGDWYAADLVVSAEGIKSSIRDEVNGEPIEPVDTGDVAYRILVSTESLLKDPETRYLVENAWAVHWLGPEGHAVGYPLRNGELYNIIIDITHQSDKGQHLLDDQWKVQADNRELVDRFKDWCKPVRDLCGLTGEYLKWKLVDFPVPLKRWAHPSNKVVLIGDAVHPMMPYLAQGAAQAIEDAATLRAAIAEFDSLPEALAIYQKQRATRATYVAQNTRVLQEWLHLYDGPARDQRDELMKHDNSQNPIFWGHTARKDWLFGYDAGSIHTDEDRKVPPLPPLPPKGSSVYVNKISGAAL